ncbi:MAG: DEAD/DEAH box helicase [Pseudomonadales bacterium]|nr:DEAD/DEAH box helicase [Pseudomonadales bacterium]NRA13951.1 DEAD/DEAH box helicase [Oceanospirillaceae bacterium]
MANFSQLNLCPELQFTLEQLGYKQTTEIQAKAIPVILAGNDILAQAQTGTGKTAGFALPMIEKLRQRQYSDDYHPIRGLVLTPTRELAIQVAEKTLSYGSELGMRVVSLYGGVRFDNQIRKMKRGADILVATPGRLLEMLIQRKFSLEQLEILVFDEADRMLDLGFIHDINRIMSFAPKNRQTLLFSATYNDKIESWAHSVLNNPQKISVSPSNSAAKKVQQLAYKVDNNSKEEVLIYLITSGKWKQTLVFTRTKRRADKVAAALIDAGINALAIHGDKLQKERIAALTAFSEQQLDVLVATDVAARGLDIEALPRVVNFDLPNQSEAYVHRIGRTARAGKSGQAISFVAPDERQYLLDIEQLLGKQLQFHSIPLLEKGKLVSEKAAGIKRANNSKRKTAKAKFIAPELEKATKPALRPSLLSKKK